LPDIVNATWYDPRKQQDIINQPRAARCIMETAEVFGVTNQNHINSLIVPVYLPDYDRRKRLWATLADDPNMRFSKIKKKYWRKYKKHFIRAARKQRDFVRANI